MKYHDNPANHDTVDLSNFITFNFYWTIEDTQLFCFDLHFLIKINMISYTNSYNILEDWLSKCNTLRKLDLRLSNKIMTQFCY